jgi:hypothetical protein
MATLMHRTELHHEHANEEIKDNGAMKLDLNDVTVCAIDSANLALTARALQLTMAQCEFSDAVLFSPVPIEGAFRTISIAKLNSLADYQIFSVKKLPALIDAPFVLVVQWDGYVINPRAWNPSFREYDYIGARWPNRTDGMTVGNAGFSLRSRKLLAALNDPRFTADGTKNDDVLICRTFRPVLEREFGIRFAPEGLADQFSYENIMPNQPTFGFHGMANMWRHVEDAEMIKLVGLLAPYVCRTPHYIQLMLNYFYLRKFCPLTALYLNLKSKIETGEMLGLIKKNAPDENIAMTCVRMCERLSLQS